MKHILCSLSCFLLLLTACKKTVQEEEVEIRFEIPTKTNENQLVYAGEIPCADCERIQMILILNIEGEINGENHYELTRTYKGKSENKTIEEGSYNVEKGLDLDCSAKIYVLNWDKNKNERQYFAEYNNNPHIIYLLNQEGQPIDSQLNYKLKLIE